MPQLDLQFDAATHVYTLDGRVVPSVTQALQVLQTFDGIPAAALEAARVRGVMVHAACDLLDREALDWSSLDPSLVPYVEGYRNWLDESGAVVIASELRVASSTYRYAGTLDMLVEIGSGRLAVVDRKATATLPATVGPQTAAYAQAAEETHGHKRLRRYCLHLHPAHQRGYKLTELKDPADWSVFQSCLNVHHWRMKHAN